MLVLSEGGRLGAYGVICPWWTMPTRHVLVEATTYRQGGPRSFGPARGLLTGIARRLRAFMQEFLQHRDGNNE